MAQSYDNHRRWVPMYHFVAPTILLATIIGAVVNLTHSSADGLYSASLLLVLGLVVSFNYYFLRTFALKAQDRAIRAEENLRHFVMTGNLLDPKLDTRQIIGLRLDRKSTRLNSSHS